VEEIFPALQNRLGRSRPIVIAYISKAEHAYTMRCFLRTWGIDLARRIKLLGYENLPPVSDVKAATWIFSDLERLSPAESEAANQLWMQISELVPRPQLLNHPSSVLGRYDLLRLMHDQGINSFRAFRLAEDMGSLRFPVFIRGAAEHTGSLTPLVHEWEGLERATAGLLAGGFRKSDLLVVEFCDTSDENGIFRKYSAFRVGSRIIPRYVLFSRNWVLKDDDLVNRETIAEELAFLRENPHRAEVMQLFQMANIDYGRVDYSLLGEKPQVWEINTNPMVIMPPWSYKLRHLPVQWSYAQQIRSAFQALDSKATDD
jgi:hypothetical protein